MSDNSFKKVKDIELGDKTMGGQVLAVFKFMADPNEMYVIRDRQNEKKKVIVSGSHLIKENDRWIRVRDSIRAKRYRVDKGKQYKKPFIYCLNTSKSVIFTDLEDIVFRDYDECKDYDVCLNIQLNQINSLNLDCNCKLEFKRVSYDSDSEYSLHGKSNFGPLFDKNTKIRLRNGNLININKLNLGDDVASGGKVTGIVSTLRQKIPIFKYGHEFICSQGVVINNFKGKWEPIWERCKLVKNYEDEIMYSIFTETGVFMLGECFVTRDYDICPEMTTQMEKYLEKSLNS